MTEVDAKLVRPVEASLSLFEHKACWQDYCLVNNWEGENSANYDGELEVYQRRIEELSAQLELTESDRDRYLEECKKSQAFLSMLESEYEGVIDQLVEFNEYHKNLLQVVYELKPMKDELLELKSKLISAKELKLAALRKAELLQNSLDMEKEKNRELKVHVSELNALVISSNLVVVEAEGAKSAFVAAMEEELHNTAGAIIQLQQQVKLDEMTYLGEEVLEKTFSADYFQLELKEAKELLNSDMELMEKVIYDNNNYNMFIEAESKKVEEELQIARGKVDDLNCQVETLTTELQYLKDKTLESKESELEKTILIYYFQLELKQAKEFLSSEMRLKEKLIFDSRNYDMFIEAESKRTEELQIAKEKVDYLNRQVEAFTSEIQYEKNKVIKGNQSEVDLQVEVAMLKSELRKSRARIAAAEYAESRATSIKYGLHLAVQELAVELEAAKRDLQNLNVVFSSGITISLEEYESLRQKAEMTDKIAVLPPGNESQFRGSGESQEVNILKDEPKTGFCSGITISQEEYESLCQKAEMVDNIATSPPRNESQLLKDGNSQEVVILKDDLETELSSGITISLEEYESLCRKTKMVDTIAASPPRNKSQSLNSGNSLEVNILKEELETANAKINALSFTVDEAARRAQKAERAKIAVEEQLRQWRQAQAQRRAASEEHQRRKNKSHIHQVKPSAHKPPFRSSSLQDVKVVNYIPLGKVLNMKF